MQIEVLGTHTLDSQYDIPFELPYPKNPNFTGREGLLDRLDTQVRSRSSKIIVLYGMGGIGKTQIALQYVHTNFGEYSSVFWVDGTSQETANLGFRSIAQKLVRCHATRVGFTNPNYTQVGQDLGLDLEADGQLSVKSDCTTQIVEAVKRWYCRRENRNWLLVLDNVDDLTSFDISAFIPTTSHGLILLTSRRAMW